MMDKIRVSSFSESDMWGFHNYKGVVIPPMYDEVLEMSRKLIAVKLNNKWGFIDGYGKEVVPLHYDTIDHDWRSGLVVVSLNEKYGFVDEKGKEILAPMYDSMWVFNTDFLAASLNDKYGFFHKLGLEITPLMYDEVKSIYKEFAAVALNDKWGIIDSAGDEVIPLKYDDVLFIVDGVAVVNIYGGCEFVTKQDGEMVHLNGDVVVEFNRLYEKTYEEYNMGFITYNEKFNALLFNFENALKTMGLKK